MTTFEAGKTYRTRDGREALIYCTDAPGAYPIHGRIGETLVRWNADGSFFAVPGDCADLLPPEPPHIREKRWCNVTREGDLAIWKYESDARVMSVGCTRIAVPCLLTEIVEDKP